MSINNKVTFRRKHRPVWYGMLCLVLITAAVSTMSLIPAQSSDLSSAESVGDYTLTDGKNIIDSDGKFESIIEIINDSKEGSVFTIIVNDNDTNFPGFELNPGKGTEVTLTSSSNKPFTLTITEEDKRHFTVVSGTLALENIILDSSWVEERYVIVEYLPIGDNYEMVSRSVGGGVGGGITVEESGTLVMNKGAVIKNCFATYGAGVYSAGKFTINGGTIENNEAYGTGWSEGSGGGVYNDGGTFEMNGGKIYKNKAKFGGGVYNDGGTFTMEGGEISYNEVRNDGGGVCNDDGTFVMNKGKILKNKAGYGGGVYNWQKELIMTGGEISDNTARDFGGGVCTENGTFEMSGGKIIGNKSEYSGGGVYAYHNKYGAEITIQFTMTGGEISGNTAKETGGGVRILGNTIEFAMYNGVISGNTAGNNGGGIYNGCKVSIYNGKISGNTALNSGGGVYTFGVMFTMTVGEISGNTAKGLNSLGIPYVGSGGGIFAENYAKVKVEDGVVFSGNTAPTLRTENIEDKADADINRTSDLDDYKNIGAVTLSAPANPELNAPAYNNFDINYYGDTYVVAITADPNGGGTVTAAQNGNYTVYIDGYVLVPISDGKIILSATPKSGYEFKQFVIDGSKTSMDSIVFKVSGYMTVVAEFSLISTQPEQKDNVITATAENGSEITPSGAVKVPYGESKTFTFSAQPGYKITAVLVDGIPISSAELASGEYTFRDVKSGHEIEVVSEADDGSDVGAGGNDVGAGGSGGWIVLGMVCVMLLIFSGAVVLIARKDRLRTGSGPEQP